MVVIINYIKLTIFGHNFLASSIGLFVTKYKIKSSLAAVCQLCDFTVKLTGSGLNIASGDLGQNTVCLYMVRAAVAI